MKDVSFVILNYNDADTTVSLVDRLLRWHCAHFVLHVVVVDNRSTDESLQVLRNYCSVRQPVACTLDLVPAQRNGGYSYGNNVGTRFALETYDSEYIAIANPDIQVDEDTVTELLDTFEASEQIALCAPVVVSADGTYRVKPGIIPTWQDDMRACRLRNTSALEDEGPWPTIEGYPDYILTNTVLGAFFVIRSDVFLQIGLLDEGVFLFCEERILGHKILEEGYVEVLRGDLRYVHNHSTTISKSLDSLRTQRIMLQSRAYYQRVYGRVGPVRRMLFRLRGRIQLLELRGLYALREIT